MSDKKPKMKRVKVTDINQLSFATVCKGGETVYLRAGKVAFVMSQMEGCKIFSDNGLHVESKDPADHINQVLNQCYDAVAQGFYETVDAPPAPKEPSNRNERRAEASKKRK